MAKGEDGAVKEKKVKTLAEIMNDYGLNVITEYEEVARLPSGSLELDRALGGGWAVGRIQEIWGAPSFGKSLLATIGIGRALFMGKKAALFDLEMSFDSEWSSHFMDVDSENFILIQQRKDTTGESILNSILELSDKGVDLIVLDSKDAIVFAAEIEGGVGPKNMGLRSQSLGNFMRRLAQIIQDSNTTFIFTSEVRANFGNTYSPYTTSGGHQVDHKCAIQLSLNQPSALKVTVDRKDTVVGTSINTFTNKNKTARAKLNSSVDIREFKTETGSIWAVDTASEVLKIGTELQLFTLADGRVYDGAGNIHWKGENYGTKNAALTAWRAEPVLLSELEQAIRVKLGWVTE